MSWSYSGDPSSSPLDEMRFVLGDTTPNTGLDPNNELLQNEEINYALTKYPDFFTAAVVLCEAIIAKFTRLVDETTGDETVRASARALQYRRLSEDLRKKIGFTGALFYVGGTSKTENDRMDHDTDRVKPQFRVGIMDNPYAAERGSEREDAELSASRK